MQDGILVVGSQRSGTTLLNRILNGHSDIAMLFQQSNFLRLDPQSYDLTLPTDVRRLITDAKQAYSAYSGRFDDTVERGIIEEFLLSRTTVPTVGEIYQSILRRLSKKRAARYWGEKYAGRALDALKFIDIVPEGKIVQIVRDPRDVCASEKQRLIRQLGKDESDRTFLLMVYDWKIAHFIGGYLQSVVPGNYHRIRYEDLVKNPEQVAARICYFLNLPYDRQMVESARFTDDDGAPWQANSFFEDNVTTVRPDFQGRWRATLDPATIRFVEKFCESGMRELRYPLPGVFRSLATTFKHRTYLRELAADAELQARSFLYDPAYKAYVPARFIPKIDFRSIDPIYREESS